MRRGPKPSPRANAHKGSQLDALPRCPAHLNATARREWRRLAGPLYDAGILTVADRAALAAYCQAYARWVEAEEYLRKTPPLIKTPSGYVQQSPWLSIANKQLEIVGRYMAELGLSPAARTRLDLGLGAAQTPITRIEFVAVGKDSDGNIVERPLYDATRQVEESIEHSKTITYELDKRL
ncbi:phage terminase small subunit P27 family [Oceanicola sp. 22II-s10i]|uniref:phage terminase small subunit P27 family n=1 Tax=Oceanicola sp. 22II-s10i TaxID=1317116 RepID=UPI0020CE063F|nr:phage terminase small subunit P27 family [Oceanicola sp. 22II-s10i]